MVRVTTNLLQASIAQVQRSLARGETTYETLCNQSFKTIDEVENLNSFITTCKDEATKKACQLDQELQLSANSRKTNPLYGIPISIKDNFCTKSILTTCGSKMLHDFVPPYDATAVTKLKQNNCVIVGKTNMDEFAMGSSSTTSYYGPTANFWKRDSLGTKKPAQLESKDWHMAGGSSTGSAVSVASGACFASLGTDTGGSTRQPASLTGIVGFKPTYGLISRFGLIPLAHCLDVVSILARTVDDVGLVFDAVVGQDENDLTSVDHRVELQQTKFQPDKGFTLRIGVPEEFVNRGDICTDISEAYESTLKYLSSKQQKDYINYELVKLELPSAKLATECYTVISSAEIASNMSCYDGVKYGFTTEPEPLSKFNRDEFYKRNRDLAFGFEVKKRILLGNYFLLSGNRDRYLTQAMKLRRLISDEFDRAFKSNKVDVILTPSTPNVSVSYEEWLKKQDSNKLFHEDYFLIPSNLANLPAISLPNGMSSKGLPIGMQLIGNKFSDLDVLMISKLFEASVFNRHQ